jgi:hypothetical protein
MDGSYKDAVREELCERLAEGRSLVEVCKADDMPSVRSVQNWMNDDPLFAAQITRAREVGYMIRAENAVIAAKTAEDATKGRLAFDAERWYLGKLSNAFSDDKARKHEHSGPDGAPIPVKNKLDLSGLSDEQLSALASIRI